MQLSKGWRAAASLALLFTKMIRSSGEWWPPKTPAARVKNQIQAAGFFRVFRRFPVQRLGPHTLKRAVVLRNILASAGPACRNSLSPRLYSLLTPLGRSCRPFNLGAVCGRESYDKLGNLESVMRNIPLQLFRASSIQKCQAIAVLRTLREEVPIHQC